VSGEVFAVPPSGLARPEIAGFPRKTGPFYDSAHTGSVAPPGRTEVEAYHFS